MFFTALLCANALFLLCAYFWLTDSPASVAALGVLLFVVIFALLKQQNKQRDRLIKSLEQGFLSFSDGDFSINLADDDNKQNQLLISLFNQTGEKLRRERQHLYQREMLLDKVLNASSLITILVDDRDNIVFANQAAQHNFNINKASTTANWADFVTTLSVDFQNALKQPGESIFTLFDSENQPQAWQLSLSSVRIHHASHRLYLLKTITEQLSKQEVATWKKVISVLSHELNNSIAPISSMCHSGSLLANNLNEPRLDRVFKTISSRIHHLSDFIKGYASLTKLKKPQKTAVDWPLLLEQLNTLYPFTLITELPKHQLNVDKAQLEQVLINILKNAHEADPLKNISLAVTCPASNETQIAVSDQGTGMSSEVINNAFLPFYSTKHSGTGIGLALCREIIDAHHGRMIFTNIKSNAATKVTTSDDSQETANTGLRVTLILPNN
jgi:two-component system nitrogen regulation sensor histidine kinase NtrY